ncbi:Arginine N-methyltransferase 2 [Serendipita sp. 411]|nr:Arginine N-methyltransferase 2 [Serendipita sp. 411]
MNTVNEGSSLEFEASLAKAQRLFELLGSQPVSNGPPGRVPSTELDSEQTVIDGSREQILTFLRDEPDVPLWTQEDETGWSVLHFAAHREDAELVKRFIESGAVWNLVDTCGYTAGDVALSLNNEECYRLIRDAGIRSEFLLHLLENRNEDGQEDGADEEGDRDALILRAEDATPAGSNDAFLEAKLTFTTDERGQELCLVNAGSTQIGVMMGWERPIMEETVRLLHQDNDEPDFRVLNCGFGLGIIDGLFESWSSGPPALHVIIEPHPDVLAHMKAKGWYSKPNVKILEGKWQDFMDSEEILGVGGFDAIYTDPFSESYKDLNEFFERVPDLLRGPDSAFSFFNGLGATNLLFYDVYTNLAEMHLNELGCTVTWTDVDVHTAQTDGTWGETRKYFALPYCRTPLVKMKI